LKIAAYCRVSTDKEDQLNSLQVQKEFFAEYADRQGFSLVRLYADEGISGTKIKRRVAFQQMMADAERGLFQMLIVKDISRLARNTVDLLQSVRKLKTLGVETVFLTANMTSMGDSEFVLTVFGALAQEESRNTSKRVKFSKRINAEKGKVPNLVYGYDKIPGDYFHLLINQEEATVVRQIYSWYLQDGCGGSKIADMLNRRGLKTKRGCSWSQNAVCRILTNPIYTGKIINGKQEIQDFLTGNRVDRDEAQWLITENEELRIISNQQFQEASDLMKRRNARFRQGHSRQSNRHLFSTLIRCASCGRSFRRISRTYQNTYIRWVCSKHNGQGVQNCPNAVALDEEALIDGLDEYFFSLLADRARVEQILRMEFKELRRKQPGQNDGQTMIERRLIKLEKQRKAYLELYADELISRQELQQKLECSNAELAELRKEQQKMAVLGRGEAATEEMIKRMMADLREFVSVRRLNNAQLKQLVSKMEVGEDGAVDVYLRPFPDTGALPQPE